MSQTTVKTSMRAIDEATAVLTRHRMSRPVEHEGQVSSVCTCGVMKTGRNHEDIEDQAARHLAAMLAEAGLL